ncbi:hypothetical protein Tco_0302110, partial [Tanacetum coccineum]
MTNTTPPVTVTPPVNTTGALVTNTVPSHAEKPEKFNETGSSARLDDEVVQDKRQRDDNDLQDERQDQTEEEEVELRRSKRARNEKSFRPDFVSFMVENEPTSYQGVVTFAEWLNGKKPLKVK